MSTDTAHRIVDISSFAICIMLIAEWMVLFVWTGRYDAWSLYWPPAFAAVLFTAAVAEAEIDRWILATWDAVWASLVLYLWWRQQRRKRKKLLDRAAGVVRDVGGRLKVIRPAEG